jgi:hypothetical protein
MQKLKIIFNSGATLVIKADNWQVEKNTNENAIERFQADSVTPRLPYINLSEIAAIVAL